MQKLNIQRIFFISGLLIFLLQFRLLSSLWLKYAFILFFLGYSTYWFVSGFLFPVIKKADGQWIPVAASGILMSVTSALLAVYPSVQTGEILILLKIAGITHYVFSYFQLFRYREHSRALFHFLVAVALSVLVYV